MRWPQRGWTYTLLCGEICFLFLLAGFTNGCTALVHNNQYSGLRTLTTQSYEVRVQRSGVVDISLTTGDTCCRNTIPMMWLDGEKAPHKMSIDGHWTTRIVHHSALGDGNGFAFRKQECVWEIQTYPAYPYLTLRVVFINRTKKAVYVRSLSPVRTKISLGEGTGIVRALLNLHGYPSYTEMRQIENPCESDWNIALFNSATHRSLVAGFLTQKRADTTVKWSPEPNSASGTLEAICTFKPPVKILPGEHLESELFYLSLAEDNVMSGLERFGQATSKLNHTGSWERLPFSLDGWMCSNAISGNTFSEQSIENNITFINKNLKRYGWRHVTIGKGWERISGDWRPDPDKFPHGLQPIIDKIHSCSMTAGITISPLLIDNSAPIAHSHPDWIRIPLPGSSLSKTARILDITVPEAALWLKKKIDRMQRAWNIDSLTAVNIRECIDAVNTFRDTSLTRMEIYHHVLSLLRPTVGIRKAIIVDTPSAIPDPYISAIQLYSSSDCNRGWDNGYSLIQLARHYYMAPDIVLPMAQCGRFEFSSQLPDSDRAKEQSIAWFTALALSGGVIQFCDIPSRMTDENIAVLRCLLPVPRHPARPVDLFDIRGPCIWSLPLKTPVGQWNILGIFNWDIKNPRQFNIPFWAVDLDIDQEYTVFDFWNQRFMGISRKTLSLSVPPGSVRLLGLRPYYHRPQFLASDRHFSQGAEDCTSLIWNPDTHILKGRFNAIENTPYRLFLLSPPPYQIKSVSVSIGGVPLSSVHVFENGEIIVIVFFCQQDGPVEWWAGFLN